METLFVRWFLEDLDGENNRVFRSVKGRMRWLSPFSGQFQNGLPMLTAKAFSNVTNYDLSLSWEACFQGGRSSSKINQSEWLCPPDGHSEVEFFFFLNFKLFFQKKEQGQ